MKARGPVSAAVIERAGKERRVFALVQFGRWNQYVEVDTSRAVGIVRDNEGQVHVSDYDDYDLSLLYIAPPSLGLPVGYYTAAEMEQLREAASGSITLRADDEAA